MNYDYAIITTAGAALLQDLALTSGELTISHIKTGKGSYSSGEDLASRTQLKSQMQSFDVFQVEKDTNDQIRITSVATNEGLIEGYRMTEMGLFALNADEEEILLAIAVTYNEYEADYMPADNQSFLASINILSYIKVSNNVTVNTVSDTGYAALSDYLITKKKVDIISLSDDGEGNVLLTLPI